MERIIKYAIGIDPSSLYGFLQEQFLHCESPAYVAIKQPGIHGRNYARHLGA